MSNKIYITADWHLAEGAWKPRPEIAGDAFESLRHLLGNLSYDEEADEIVDYILAAGDLFDMKHPSSETVNEVCDLLRVDAPEVNHYVLFIQGQHEMAKVPWMRVADGLYADYRYRQSKMLFPQYCIQEPIGGTGIYVWGMNWTLSLHLQEHLDEIGRLFAAFKAKEPNSYNILMLHQTCNAVMAGMGTDRDTRLESLDFRACELNDGMLPTGFDLIVVGDTHYHTEFQLRDKSGKLNRCLSPGSFAMQSVSETNTGQCFVLDTETKEISSVELYRRKYQEIQIDSPVDFDREIREKIKFPKAEDQFQMPIIRYTLYENDADRIASLKQACQDKAHPFFVVVSAEGEQEQIELQQAESVDDLIMSAIQEADATEKTKTLLTDLISSNSSDEVLGRV